MVHGKVWESIKSFIFSKPISDWSDDTGQGCFDKMMSGISQLGGGASSKMEEFLSHQAFNLFLRDAMGRFDSGEAPYADIFGLELWEGLGWKPNGVIEGPAKEAAQDVFAFRMACSQGRRKISTTAMTGHQGEDFEFIKNMAKNRKLAGSIADAAWGKIRTQFTYKSEWAGCHLVVAPQFYASSKLCSVCGYYKEDLKLSERTWVCPHCGEHHDRDVNAAVNLRAYGLWLLDLPFDEHLRTVSFTGIACGTGESDTVVQVPKAPVHRDRRLQFFQERCLSLKQEFSTYLGNL
jgi:putative transposase